MKKRSAFGSFTRTPNQIKAGFVLVCSVLLSMAGMIAILFTKLSSVIALLEAAGKIDSEAAGAIHATLQTSLIFFVLLAVGVAVGGLVFALRITRRIVGPVIAIGRFANQLKEGDYNQVLKLREGDDFEDIAASLNELARRLAAESRALQTND